MSDPVSQAEGFLELGLFEEAWNAIEEVEPESRTHPRALRARMFAAFSLQHLDTAEVLARLLSHAESPERMSAGTVLRELAAIHLIAGQEAKARDLVRAAIHADPDVRLAVLDDPDLQGLL